MESNCVLEHLPFPGKNTELHAAFLLNHVQGEFEDEDGDWATDFIIADPIPAVFRSLGHRCSPHQCGRKRHHDQGFAVEAEGSFVCGVCDNCLPLQMLGPDLECSCLCCTPCLLAHVESCLSQDPRGSSQDRENDGAISERETVYALSCPSCHQPGLSSSAIQSLAPQAWKKLEEKASDIFFKTANYVQCPGCSVTIEKAIGDIPLGVEPSGVPEFDRTAPFTEFDDDGRPMSRIALFDKYNNFFRCSLCKVGFCGLCMKVPYHLGYTCQEFEKFQNAVRCLYCETPLWGNEYSGSNLVSSMTVRDLRRDLDKEGIDTSWCVEKREIISVHTLASSVCHAKDCRRRLSRACTRSLECGHFCGGLRGERACLPCLEDSCHETPLLGKRCALPSASDWCSICMVEPLRSAPSIQLKCGHIVHFECAKRKLKEGFPGPEISFAYLNCPQCSAHMEHESLVHDMRRMLELQNLVKESALNRLRTEKKVPLMEPREIEAYAMRKYLYYICYKCKNPYFGGNRECGAEQALGLQEDAGMRNLHNPAELVCGGCSVTAGDNTSCKKGHGTRYLEFKCRYCCSIATYFCFGQIHFCSSCHQTRPDARLDFVPHQCRGSHSCPLKVAHPPNGQEYCLGCSMCRILSQ